MTETVTRFAPSPTGLLHPGHAYSAIFACEQAQQQDGGRFLLRIEDIDPVRCDPHYIDAIYEDLHWLGLSWETPVRRQSEHMADYRAALDKLDNQGLLYPCFCTRKEIRREIEESGHAPHDISMNGPEGLLYPGRCKHISRDEKAELLADPERAYALRLDMDKALSLPHCQNLTWHDRGAGAQNATPEIMGDVVLARKDIATSYHLSVTVDDALQGVTLVTRSEDLFYASHLHRLLQALLDLPVPEWHHHKILNNADGQRFAKRDQSITLRYLRAKGTRAQDILAMFN